MKLRLRDLIATVVVAAIGLPYIGYLLNGEMPFIKDREACPPLAWCWVRSRISC